MCWERCIWQGELSTPYHAAFRAIIYPTPPTSQVRVVQHKQTRDLYALKYINKAKCVKMKAVSNIVQERRLLEEVRRHPLHGHRYGLSDTFHATRLTIPSLSTCVMRSKMMKTASSSLT
jgi:serine/threonine protein kinase